MTQDRLTEAEENVLAVAKQNWGWLLALGILFVILGTVGLGMTVALTLTSLIFLGAFMIAGGVFQLVAAFREKTGKRLALGLLLAVLYIIAGIWVIQNPAMASAFATAMIAGLITALGILRLLAAFERKPESGWLWMLLSGITSLLLAGMIFMAWPSSALWVIGLFLAIEMIFHGWAYIFTALALRKA